MAAMWKERVHDLPSFSWKTPVASANAAGYPVSSSLAKKVSGQGQLTQTGDERDELQPLSEREPWDLDVVWMFRLLHDEDLEWAIEDYMAVSLYSCSPTPSVLGIYNNSPGLTFRWLTKRCAPPHRYFLLAYRIVL
jgi:hypothetical protein